MRGFFIGILGKNIKDMNLNTIVILIVAKFEGMWTIKLKRYKGIIFDLDGTLLDTIEDLGDSMNKVLQEFNLPIFSYEEYKLKVEVGLKA